MTVAIARHRTAMERTALSRPMGLAIGDGMLTPGSSVFDYGCGGGDLRRLRALGFVAEGWDPAFAPNRPQLPADVVNLGYVVNVIERPAERADVLRSAWALARRLLVVSARLEWEARSLSGRVHGDGLVTGRGTFQKLFRQEELQAWIEATLGVAPVATAPGVFYVFRNSADSQRFLAARVRRSSSNPPPLMSERLFEEHRPLFDELSAFVAARGRLPRPDELPCVPEVVTSLGSIGRAFSILRRVTGAEQWQTIAAERARDLLVYLALANFGHRPTFAGLPKELQYDVRDLFGSYKSAIKQADELSFAAGNHAAVETSARAATVGKLTQEALYVHISALPSLPPVLRVYEGCGRALTGTVDGSNLIKLHRQKAQVSYLEYPTFDTEAHPSLSTVVIARLSKLDVTFRDFRESTNPPVLHRKETFVGLDYPNRALWARLTAQEEAKGLLDDACSIGTRDGWTAALATAGYRVAGHQVRRSQPQDDDPKK